MKLSLILAALATSASSLKTVTFKDATGNNVSYVEKPTFDQKKVDAYVLQTEQIVNSTHMDKCGKCLTAIALGKQAALNGDVQLIPAVLTKLCKMYKFSKTCDTDYGAETTGYDTDGTHAAQTLTLIDDPYGTDGQYLCYYKVNQACPLPELPKFDLKALGWWGDKPDNVTVPKSENKTFNVAHLSDLHIDLRYEMGAEANCTEGGKMCCTPDQFNKGARAAGLQEAVVPAQKYGMYTCDVPPPMIDLTLQTVGQFAKEKEFEFAIFTGDMVSHDVASQTNLANTALSEEAIYHAFKKYMGDVPVFMTYGNHDTFPYGQLAQHKSGYGGYFVWNDQLSAQLWKDYGWIDAEAEQQAIHTYGSFATTTKRGLRVISLDSNLWYKKNFYNFWNTSTDPDPSGLFRFLSDELLECEKTGQRAWLMAHIPPGGNMDNSLAHSTEIIRQIVSRFSNTISGLFFGHVHEDQFNVWYAGNGSTNTVDNALQIAFLGPSVTPLTYYNPAWRYYEVDTKTFEVMNSHTYYAKLNESFAFDFEHPVEKTIGNFSYLGYPQITNISSEDVNGTAPVYHYEYNAREAYDPDHEWPANAPLNATFWHKAVDYIVNRNETRDLFLKYEYRQSPYVPKCADDNCLANVYCFLSSGTVPQVVECQKNHKGFKKQIYIKRDGTYGDEPEHHHH
ncbi:YALIA101S01e21660g1_1 [Yarrowia lipolytica]|nr:Putative sphingomyelin phosphodiesterase asm-3 [Yarrowia lipolytica]SEI31375.1 YALIA101S01e21660g1_1 [Yarrowia lipolytica]